MDAEDQRFRDATLRKFQDILNGAETNDRKLEVKDIKVRHRRDPHNLTALGKVARAGRTYGDRVYGDVALVDKNTGQTLNSGQVHLANLPVRTPYGMYLVDGTQYQGTKQEQLKGTAYTRKKKSGEVVSDFRLERGKNFNVQMDPESEQFTMYANGKYRLYPFLKALGVSDKTLKQRWPQSVYQANVVDAARSEKDLRKFADKVLHLDNAGTRPFSEVQQAITQHFTKESEINPEASQLTLGAPYTHPDSDAILASTKKILGIHQGTMQPDQRDEIFYKRFRDMPETVNDWLDKKAKGVQIKLNRRIAREDATSKEMKQVLGTKPLEEPLKSYFTQSRLQGAGETTNLLDILANDSKVTIMGEGGISDRHRIVESARDVLPSAAGFIDPVKTPQGSAGISQHLSINSDVRDGKLYTSLVNTSTNRRVERSPEDLAGKTIAFPNQLKREGQQWVPIEDTDQVTAVRDGKMVEVAPEAVDYIIPSATEMYSEVTNLIPFLDSNSGGRAILGTQQITQALPLVDRETPLVRGNNYEESDAFTLHAKSPVAGTVYSVSKNQIRVKDKRGKIHEVPLYDNLPLNNDNFLHSTPLVKRGDQVSAGQIVADNNYTKGGVLSLGRNMNVAVMPWKGYNYEDGIVVSESAAKKLTSEHLYNMSKDLNPNEDLSYSRFAAFGQQYKTSRDLEQATDKQTGLVKPGTIVHKGDVLARVVEKRTDDPEDRVMNTFKNIHKGLVRPYRAKPITWEQDAPGEVIEAKRNGNTVQLYVKAKEPSRLADKIADRAGHKGVITKIIPDEEMPYVKDSGEKVDVIIDPSSIPSRVNVGQLLEMGAGKVAKKTGTPYVATTHTTEDNVKRIKRLMADAGVKDKETVVDPTSGKEIPNINVGPKYIMKLRHQVEHKMQSRNPNDSYDMNRQPIKGRAIDNLTFYAMVGHGGAKKNLAEMANLKANENPEWWAQYEAGEPLVLPKEPTFAWQKFASMMQGAGINVRQEGDKMLMLPLTDKETRDMAQNRKVTNFEVFRKKDLRPMPGGIFDPKLTGKDGEQWSYIDLPEPALNPVFATAASKVTGHSKSKLESIARGEQEYKGQTGGHAIEKMLGEIDVDKELAQAKAEAKQKKNLNEQDTLHQKIRYLQGLKKYGMTPTEAYTMNHVPVLPARFRLPTRLPNGDTMFPSVNENYKDLAVLATDAWHKTVTKRGERAMRKDLYNSLKAVTGMGEPLTNAEAGGLLKEITGQATAAQRRRGISRQPKEGYFQRKVMRKRQDVSGGSVITVEPNLGPDEIGMPEEMAWDVYSPMLVRRMRQTQGMTLVEAKKHIEDRTPAARSMLKQEVEQRPVFINRHPSWQRQNIYGAWPKLHPGFDIKLPNMPVNTFLGGDFDGDAVNIHVPITSDAVEEAKNLVPSKNFTKSGSGMIMLRPQQSSLAGLYDLTQPGPGKAARALLPAFQKQSANGFEYTDQALRKLAGQVLVKIGQREVYKSSEAIEHDLDAGHLMKTDLVQYEKDGKRHQETAGRALINLILPTGHDIHEQLTATKVNQLLEDIAKEDSTQLAPVANALTRLGFNQATYMGLSIGLDDLDVDTSDTTKIIRGVQKKLRQIDQRQTLAPEEKSKRKDEAIFSVLDDLNTATLNSLPQGNTLRTMYESGARGNATQLRQIVGAPTLFQRATGEFIPIPVGTSFKAGLNPAEYYIQQTGGRFGLVRRSEGIKEPGAIGKDLFNINTDRIISEDDCGTHNGIRRPINARDIVGRYLADSQPLGARNTLVTEALVRKAAQQDIEEILVRSPLTCEADVGVCRKCYGLKPGGQEATLGDPVGIQDSQGVVDRIANLALKSWHLSGGKEVGELPFDRYKRLVEMPQTVPNKAVLARVTGTVDKVETNALGGKDVFIGSARHRIPKELGLDPAIKRGVQVDQGQQLSVSGNIKPQELLEYKGVGAVQDHMVGEMANIFDADKHGGIQRRSIENLVAGMTGLAEVQDPGDSDYAPAEVVPVSSLRKYNQSQTRRRALKNALGQRVAKDYENVISKGETLTRAKARTLQGQGIKQVELEANPITYQPILKPAQMIPRYKNNWMAKLNQKYLTRTLTTGGAWGEEADIYGPDPIPAYAYGQDATDKKNQVANY